MQRRFRVTFEYDENAQCINYPDHGVGIIKEALFDVLESNGFVGSENTLEVTEIEK